MAARAPKPSTPSTIYNCRPGEARALGRVIPGRSGGAITGCATPSRERPREGQWWLGLPVEGFGHALRKSTAARRLRDQGKARRADDPSEVARAAMYALEGGRDTIPYPAGIEFPHIVGTSRCDPEHKLWTRFPDRYDEAQQVAQERADRELSDNASAEDFDAARQSFTAEDLRRDPQFDEWLSTSIDCARAWESRESARKGKALFSQQRERGQDRAKRTASREDLSGAEYLDTLRQAESKPKPKTRRRKK